MFAPLRRPDYRRLFAAQVASLLGTGLTTVALALLAYELAGELAGAVLGTALALKMVANVAQLAGHRILAAMGVFGPTPMKPTGSLRGARALSPPFPMQRT